MGVLSTLKFLKNVAGTITEQFALTTSAGAGDANAIPALNANGVLDPSITNAKVVSAGAGDAGKLPQLDGTGRLDTTVLPVGIGAETIIAPASEALAAGNFVNIWNNAGVANVRKADASVAGKEANGFVLAAVALSGTATVYQPSQANTQLSALTPGAVVAAAPAGTGKVVQTLGRANSATSMVFNPGMPITLA